MPTRRMLLGTGLATGLATGLVWPALDRAAQGATAGATTTLTLWHDLGEPGNAWFHAAAQDFAAAHPGFVLQPISYPTDQWFGRVIAALNTSTAPDLIFNNYERVIRIANQTNRVMDLKEVLAGVADHAFLTASDLKVATYKGRMIILPIQRVQMAFGVRASWLDHVGESFPQTWEDALRVGRKFQSGNPAGSGEKVYAFALEAAQPRDLIHMLDLFTVGTGLEHTLIDPAGSITIDEPRHQHVLEQFLKVFTTYHMVPPDTINDSFNEMYQVIEGGRAGMFRVGDWNARKWDQQALNADYIVGPWPQFFPPDTDNGVMIGGMRGVAVPENSPHKALAIAFAQSLLAAPAQQASLDHVGSAVRTDLDFSSLTPHQKQFAQAAWRLDAYDFPESFDPTYPQLEAAFHRDLIAAIAHPPKDLSLFVATTAASMRAKAKELAHR